MEVGRSQVDGSWSKEIQQWRPYMGKRSRGRPQTRWIDDLKKTAGLDWIRKTQNRDLWKATGEAYIQQWMLMG
ncbi:hypothetical protein RN001_011663 [Aquatica leii]|uniref:Endonuclease-reverse transcriptase n=1 Tax=Aquatica leii TaxID=1421715 RepID=A0AAN7P623_9COLE|nr:hypothetical protein RN001_011663 [Aquatica leii]